MRTFCGGQSVLHNSSKLPRLSVAQLARVPVSSVPSGPQRNHAKSVRRVAPAAVSAPDVHVDANNNTDVKVEEACAMLERVVVSSDAERPSRSVLTGRETLESPEELASTSEHRALVGTAMLLLAGIGAQGVAGIHDSLGGACACAAVAVAYVLAGGYFLTGKAVCLVQNIGGHHT